MNTLKHLISGTAVLALAALLSACATTPEPNAALQQARSTVEAAAQDPQINQLAAVELRKAEERLQSAETAWESQAETDEVNHRAYMAERQAQIAMEAARSRQLDQRIETLSNEREQVRLEARAARAELEASRARSSEARAEAERMLAEARAEQLERETQEMRDQAERLQQQVAELEARPTDRGLVLTLGSDVLFDFDSAELREGAKRSIDRIAEFLDEYSERQVLVEGFTDSTGSREYNLGLSERRAAAVREALVARGIEASRIRTRGFGPDYPVASNDNDAGRQLNRRVEIVISDDAEQVPDRQA